MPFRFFSPGATIFSLVFAGVMSLVFKTKKRKPTHISNQPTSEEDANIAAMKVVLSEHEDCTAEVIDINVFGRRRVETFRLLSPGRRVELRMKKDEIKVFSFGEYIAELITPADSNLPRLFNEHIHFDAYLGGRDMTFLYSDTYDSCSIIIFYKIDGIPPTKVNLF